MMLGNRAKMGLPEQRPAALSPWLAARSPKVADPGTAEFIVGLD